MTFLVLAVLVMALAILSLNETWKEFPECLTDTDCGGKFQDIQACEQVFCDRSQSACAKKLRGEDWTCAKSKSFDDRQPDSVKKFFETKCTGKHPTCPPSAEKCYSGSLIAEARRANMTKRPFATTTFEMVKELTVDRHGKLTVILTFVHTEWEALTHYIEPLEGQSKVLRINLQPGKSEPEIKDGLVGVFAGLPTIAVLTPEMGEVAAKNVAISLIEEFPGQLHALVLVGIAWGNPQQKVGLCDVVIADSALCFSSVRSTKDVNGKDSTNPHGEIGRVQYRTTFQHIFEPYSEVVRDQENQQFIHKPLYGCIIAGPVLMDNKDTGKVLIQITPKALAGDMEGCAPRWPQKYNKADNISVFWVKGISDLGGLGGHSKNKTFQTPAAFLAIDVVYQSALRSGLGLNTSSSKNRNE